jgi:hypothetical protein
MKLLCTLIRYLRSVRIVDNYLTISGLQKWLSSFSQVPSCFEINPRVPTRMLQVPLAG